MRIPFIPEHSTEHSCMNEELHGLYQSGIVSELDIHFARFMAGLAAGDVPELSLATALVSSYTRQGHICLDLPSMAGKRLVGGEDVATSVQCPELDGWDMKLRESMVVGNPGEHKPLILDDKSRLYLFRYWDYQTKLADLIRRRARGVEEDVDIGLLKEGLGRLFPASHGEEIDWQKVAAFTALMKKFCVVSGGPGTGKTTTVAKILVLLLGQRTSKKIRIALAAPTGKAAARLKETINHAKETLNCSDRVRAAIPEEASTIHRLLGTIPHSPYFHHHAKNTLPADVVVVDEASMVDLALMSKLIQAIAPQARLIMLGDKDQLASVEAGAVLGDICDTGNIHSFSKRFRDDLRDVTGYRINKGPNEGNELGIQDCIVQLQKSYRFGLDSGISAVSRAVNAGDQELAMALILSGEYEDIKWKPLPQPEVLLKAIKGSIIQGFGNYLRIGHPWEGLQLFEGLRILCALREGPYGVVAINLLVEQILREEGLIEADGRWYSGRPVLITRNDYNLRLYNGDVGIILRDPEANHDLRAFFPARDGTLRRFHPLRLPEHETAYAITVHKSQGSEFEKVLLLLPERESPVLTRELIYTAITRARHSVEIWGTENIFRTAVSRRTERTSGLRDALWEHPILQ